VLLRILQEQVDLKLLALSAFVPERRVAQGRRVENLGLHAHREPRRPIAEPPLPIGSRARTLFVFRELSNCDLDAVVGRKIE
jgi:hypothetical protein